MKLQQKNVLAIGVIDGFTETDEKLCQKYFQEKLDAGHNHFNVLVKLDEIKINHTSIKAFMEDIIWALRNYKSLDILPLLLIPKF